MNDYTETKLKLVGDENVELIYSSKDSSVSKQADCKDENKLVSENYFVCSNQTYLCLFNNRLTYPKIKFVIKY